MTTQEIVNALKCCTDLTSPYVCERCPIRHDTLTDCNSLRRQAAELIESLTAELEQTKRERDTWKRRAEAAERDITSMLESCDFEIRHEYCARCYPSNQCNTDECAGYAKWRGPCAENGGTDAAD